MEKERWNYVNKLPYSEKFQNIANINKVLQHFTVCLKPWQRKSCIFHSARIHSRQPNASQHEIMFLLKIPLTDF